MQAVPPSGPSRRLVVAQGLFSWQIGGSERVAADLALELRRRGHEVICFAFYDSSGPIKDELKSRGVACADLNYLNGPRFVRRFTYQVAVLRFLRRHRVDVLLVHHAVALMLAGLPAKAAGVRRVVMVEHALHQLKAKPLYRAESKLYCRLADTVVTVDPGIGDYFRDVIGVPGDRIRYVANGARIEPRDPQRRSKVRAALGIADDELVFLFAGRLEAVKDVPTLLAATAEASGRTSRMFRVLVAGDGSLRSALEQESERLGLAGRVRFLGPRSDVRDLLQAADAFVMTSVTEGQPMALIEAMASGVPSIATSVGGIPALLGDGAGRLTRPGDPSSTAEAMVEVMDSEATRERLAQAGLRRADESHSLERTVDVYESLLR